MIRNVILPAAFALSVAVGAAAGHSLPLTKPATFQLVAVYANGESDILDHDLSAGDCGFQAAANAAFSGAMDDGATYVCEAE